MLVLQLWLRTNVRQTKELLFSHFNLLIFRPLDITYIYIYIYIYIAPNIDMAARNAKIIMHIQEEMQMHLKVK